MSTQFEQGVPIPSKNGNSQLLADIKNLPLADVVAVEDVRNLIISASTRNYASKLASDNGLFVVTRKIKDGENVGSYRLWRVSQKAPRKSNKQVTVAASATSLKKSKK